MGGLLLVDGDDATVAVALLTCTVPVMPEWMVQ
jgi:hypothetical protein